jgi:hypothetical protein
MRSWSESRGIAAVVALLALGCGGTAKPSAAPAAGGTTLWGYEFVELFTDRGISTLTHRVGHERIDVTLIRDVSPEVAADYIDDEVTVFESLFTLKRTGYPGQTTRYIECPPEMRPRYGEKPVGDDTLRYFHGFANANFVAGVAARDLAAYRLIKGYLPCRELRAVFEIEHFSPLEGDDLGAAFLDRLGCPAALP